MFNKKWPTVDDYASRFARDYLIDRTHAQMLDSKQWMCSRSPSYTKNDMPGVAPSTTTWYTCSIEDVFNRPAEGPMSSVTG